MKKLLKDPLSLGGLLFLFILGIFDIINRTEGMT